MEPRKKDTNVSTYQRQRYKDIALGGVLLRRLQQRFTHRPPTQPMNLYQAATWTLVGLAVFALTLWVGLGWVLGGAWPWELDSSQTTEYSITRMVLFVGAGMVGVVGVVVAYRRQQGIEGGQFLERLAESARLLGDQNPTIQAAGIYSLAGLADAEGHARRQQCIDVLCAYIRLPYSPSASEDAPGVLTNIVRKRTDTYQTGSFAEERTLEVRPYDRQTRETIIRVITQHLRQDAETSWSDFDFDFTGAIFDYGDFSDAVFSGKVSFVRAQFIGGVINFKGARFAGSIVSFLGARFVGGNVVFMESWFTEGVADFRSAQFVDGKVNFFDAQFDKGAVDFGRAHFIGGTVDFRYARFTGSRVRFQKAQFAGGYVDFSIVRNWGTPPEVPWTDVSKAPVGVIADQWPPQILLPLFDDAVEE